jgi:hypothetical protein
MKIRPFKIVIIQSPLMSPNPLLCVIFHWLGGLASGSFYVPPEVVEERLQQ